jgi:hypothetical protein
VICHSLVIFLSLILSTMTVELSSSLLAHSPFVFSLYSIEDVTRNGNLCCLLLERAVTRSPCFCPFSYDSPLELYWYDDADSIGRPYKVLIPTIPWNKHGQFDLLGIVLRCWSANGRVPVRCRLQLWKTTD